MSQNIREVERLFAEMEHFVVEQRRRQIRLVHRGFVAATPKATGFASGWLLGINGPPAEPSRPTHSLFRDVRSALQPSMALRKRVQQQVRRGIGAPSVLLDARQAVTPSPARQIRAWLGIRGRLGTISFQSLWERFRARLQPSSSLSAQLWHRIAPRLEPQPAYVPTYRFLKVISAVAVLLLAVRISPILFIATPTVAESSAVLRVTRGDAAILLDGLWQPVHGEILLQRGVSIRTDNGQATITLHDDAVIRLAERTHVILHDVSNRPSQRPAQSTLSLQDGQVWILGFLPRPLQSLRVITSQAQVDVQEGSVSIQEGDDVLVGVWDRSATVTRRGKGTVLVAGEELTVRDGSMSFVRVEPVRYEASWVKGNLARDAVHQREIAQMQQERQAAAAGILPDSTLYPAKRLAEAVDVLFSFDADTRAKKIITHANTRLNEAAALIARGSGSDAVSVLQEYKDTLLAVSHGSGGTSLALLQEQAVENATALSAAALPTDDAYILKETVRETIAELPESVERQQDVLAAEILDQLSTARQRAVEGSATPAQVAELKTLLEGGASSLSPSALREARASLATIEAVVEDGDPVETADASEPETEPESEGERARIRQRGGPSDRPPLSDEQIEQKVQEILGQIYVYDQRESRLNEFKRQMRLLDRDPYKGNKGTVLRRLEEKQALPPGFMNLIEYEKQKLNDETRAAIDQQAEAAEQAGTGSQL
jgi:hypothetical protein